MNRNRDGFTLIEIIVVMSIISILAAMSIASIPTVKGRAMESRATNMCNQVKTAIMSYHGDYRRLPLPDKKQGDYTTGEKSVIDILMASDEHRQPGGMNPGGTVYLSGRAAKRNGDGYRFGLKLDRDRSGSLWDPWGMHYGVRMDIENRGSLIHPAENFSPAGSAGKFTPHWGNDDNYQPIIAESVAVFSSGRDGSEGSSGKGSNNPTSF